MKPGYQEIKITQSEQKFEIGKDNLLETSTTEGTKFDGEKPRYDLISPAAIEELAKVLTMGGQKYGDWNWSKGIKFSRVIAAILRHTFAYLKGETKDKESGLSHMAHVMCNAMFLLHYEANRPEFDDRNAVAHERTKNEGN